MRFLPAGRQGLLVECAGTEEVVGLHAALRHELPAGVLDAVPAARTLLVTFDDGITGRDRLAAHIAGLSTEPGQAAQAQTVEIAVTYDGEDLSDVAALTGLDEAELVRRHLDRDYVVAFCGFSPGFAYLVGGDPALEVPRRTTPRTRVPAGSVALAGEFTGVYPRQGPGGWQLIGHTSATLWDLRQQPPALLAPGTRVRFTRVAP
jgi:KipI family sensor histidine kinase inhibitor